MKEHLKTQGVKLHVEHHTILRPWAFPPKMRLGRSNLWS